MENKELGIYGENVVCYYLEKKGYKIIKRNFFIKGGEIDIIAEKDGVIAFVEVKTRSAGSMVGGIEAVTKQKRKLIINAAKNYGYKFPHALQPRFDIASVVADGKKVVGFDYIENAFDASGY
jgi:putative endonuclease